MEEPDRGNLPQPKGGTLNISQFPESKGPITGGPHVAAQTLGISFLGATLADGGVYPPNVMGAVGLKHS